MLPLITVITPSFNQGQFITQTIESVLSQKYPNLEFIIIDALSTDNTLAVLNEYKGQFQLIREKDNGQTDAINKGLRLATGEVVCWLNSDDYFLPGSLLTVGNYFAENTDRLWLVGDCLIVDEVGQQIQQPIRWYKRLLRLLPSMFYLGLTNAVCQPATFWRRSVHNQLGYLDESLNYTMDYDWWMRLNSIQSPMVLNDTISAFRIHKLSKGGTQYESQFKEDYFVFKRHFPSKLIGFFHSLHNKLIINLYKLMK